MAIGSTQVSAQVCVNNQQQLTQAINDSQAELTRLSDTLDTFGRSLISPRTGPVDVADATTAASKLDAFIGALGGFSTQVDQIGDTCGPQFSADAQRLTQLVAQFQVERDRAEALLADHQALVSSGEPPMSQAEMEGVQRALQQQGFYQGGIDGRFGAGTREAIGRFQSSISEAQTGYLTPAQRDRLLQPSGPATPDTLPAGELPEAPQTGEAPDEPTTPPPSLGPEAAQICTQNISEVANATERTRTFRGQVASRIVEFRRSIRGPRVPAIDGNAGASIIADVNGYLSALESFYDQAETVVGHCGSQFDESFGTLSDQLDALRSVNQRVTALNDEYAALVESGEPAMDEATMQQVQEGLKALGHYAGAIDAAYGTGTRNAIRAYQDAIGASETGYLTAGQIADLQEAAVAPPVTPELPEVPETPEAPEVVDTPTPPTPTIETPAVNAAIADARRILTNDLGQRQPPEPFSQVRPGDGRFGDHWWQARDMIAAGRPGDAVDQRLALFGAAYLDRGAESLPMVDAHLIVGDGFARLGLYGDAAFHYQRAADLWSGLGRDAGAERAALLERLAAARLAQAVANGRVAEGPFQDIRQLLNNALAALDSDDAAAGALRGRILDRLADLHAAAERQPDDAAVAEAFQARYGN